MSRIFFMSMNITEDPYPVYPLGMSICTAQLQKQGHQVQQFDFLAVNKSIKKLQQSLEDFAPDYICISIRNIDNSDSFSSDQEWYLDGFKELLAIVRNRCQAPVIVGGSAFSIMPEQILSHVGADYGVVGEGEEVLGELLDRLEKGHHVDKIVSAKTRPIPGSRMVSALYDRKLADFYIKESTVINLQTKRGCPFQCTYCTYPYLEGHEFRHRDVQEVVDDIVCLQKDFGSTDFFFTDSVFNDSQNRYLELVEEILRRDLKIRWGSFFTPRNGGLKELALMKRSGLYAVELGTDAGSDRTLSAIRKDFTFSDVMNFNQACVKNEIPCAHFIMFGGPEENEDTINEAIANTEKLDHCVVFGFSGIRILPGTQLYRQAIDDELVREDESLLKPKYYLSPKIEYQRMNDILVEGFKGRRDRVFPPPEGRFKLNTLKKFGFKGILWDQIISFPGVKKAT